MTQTFDDGATVTPPRREFEDLLAVAAARGARRVLAELGLENGSAREDIRELRSLLQALRLAKRTAWQTTVKILTTAFVLALLAWAGIKLKLLGCVP